MTRNSHVDEIGAFLAAHGVPDGVRVFPVKLLKATKAEVILQRGLFDPAAQRAVFVDDTITEHFAPELMACDALYRVLFARS